MSLCDLCHGWQLLAADGCRWPEAMALDHPGGVRDFLEHERGVMPCPSTGCWAPWQSVGA
jgi:hypothetical protein